MLPGLSRLDSISLSVPEFISSPFWLLNVGICFTRGNETYHCRCLIIYSVPFTVETETIFSFQQIMTFPSISTVLVHMPRGTPSLARVSKYLFSYDTYLILRLLNIFCPCFSVETATDADPKQFELARSVHWMKPQVGANSNSNSGGKAEGRKRKAKGGGGAGGKAAEDSEDEDTISAPVNDLYRKRQQKKMR